MDNVITVSENNTITLNLSLRKRLGDPSAYHKNSSDSKELFLFWVYRGHKKYVVIHTNIHFEHSPGYAYSGCIKEGKIVIPTDLAKPGQMLVWDKKVYPSVPIWFEVL